MNINWEINETDVQKVKTFLNEHQNPFVVQRISRNVKKQNVEIDRNSILKGIVMCLLTSQQRSGPNSPISKFLRLQPFHFTVEEFTSQKSLENFIKETLKKHGLNRYINRISEYIVTNFNHLEKTNWQLFNNLEPLINVKAQKEFERELANNIVQSFKGFGPKQSRNLLQSLGLTKYEIPIDSRITNWLNKFGFPLTLSSIALQDKEYYNFVSDGIQALCERANIFPCVLDAAIFSSFDNGEWTDDNIVY